MAFKESFSKFIDLSVDACNNSYGDIGPIQAKLKRYSGVWEKTKDSSKHADLVKSTFGSLSGVSTDEIVSNLTKGEYSIDISNSKIKNACIHVSKLLRLVGSDSKYFTNLMFYLLQSCKDAGVTDIDGALMYYNTLTITQTLKETSASDIVVSEKNGSKKLSPKKIEKILNSALKMLKGIRSNGIVDNPMVADLARTFGIDNPKKMLKEITKFISSKKEDIVETLSGVRIEGDSSRESVKKTVCNLIDLFYDKSEGNQALFRSKDEAIAALKQIAAADKQQVQQQYKAYEEDPSSVSLENDYEEQKEEQKEE